MVGSSFSRPFAIFIVSEIALGTGVVNLLGALLEPLMRPVFNVPGEELIQWLWVSLPDIL